jgi:hypothetical protein
MEITVRRLLVGATVGLLAGAMLPWPHAASANTAATSACSGDVAWWDLPHDMVAYFYALHLEKSWSKVDPQTKADLEHHLWLYSTREISPSESCWGRDWSLRANDEDGPVLAAMARPFRCGVRRGGSNSGDLHLVRVGVLPNKRLKLTGGEGCAPWLVGGARCLESPPAA